MNFVFSEMSILSLTLLRFYCLILEYLYIHVVGRSLQLKIRKHALVIVFFLCGLWHLLFELLFTSSDTSPDTRIEQRQAVPFLLAVVVMTAILLFLEWRLVVYKRIHVGEMSVKTVADVLPAGLCCYDKDGRIYMLNEKMMDISMQISGEIPTDGVLFWDEIINSTRNVDYGPLDVPVLRLDDGKVCQFHKRQILAGNREMEEITAADVTNLYAAGEQLKQQNEKQEEINRRLRQYGLNQAEVIRTREILGAKMAMHDEVGQVLLATRYAVDHPGEIDTGGILQMWEHLTAVLLREAQVDEDAASDVFENLIDVAKSIGIKIEIEGEIPKTEPAYTLTARGLHTCITNVRKHTDGDRIFLSIKKENGQVTVCFTNNGKPPADTIQETGGLLSLRELVESAGGKMEIESRPFFRLKLFLQ